MEDIQSRNDIVILVDRFYEKVLADELIGLFFTKIVKLNTKIHIPVMYDFWETTLLRGRSYKGNPMVKHIELDRMKAIEKKHFDRWIVLWQETVKENFVGEKAMLAIQRANQIAQLMQHKISDVRLRNSNFRDLT